MISLSWPRSSGEWNTFLKTSGLEPVVAENALRLAWRARQQLRLEIAMVSGYRSPERNRAEQARWDRGDRSGLVVRPADGSLHMEGRAFDVGAIGPEPSAKAWEQLGSLGESLGLRWGGRWRPKPDPVHFDS